MRLIVAAGSASLLGGCMTNVVETPPATEPVTAECSNDALGQFKGQAAGQELGGRMLAASGARTIRWVPKGGIVTMEFRADRLTVQLDENNRVEIARCG